ncbi:hypothetical protein LshimejAT787_0905200 [Lyophyllum shimeji]|uniref:Uncharacterized protein n=1 Tax=Lyophyllum shimeji TaxID=47721 RepID=A0A9P3URG4_LYOSH|nr:hypothetical protein LshimejAT787_0905200 [Lyophyllum shimeji]
MLTERIPGCSLTPKLMPPSSLHSIFPDADRADLNAVVAHTLHPCDLRKLDPRCHHHIQLCHGCIPPRPFFVTPSNSVQDYSSLDTVLVPLQIYFGILLARVPPSWAPSVTRNFQRYTARLIALADRYPWPAVRAYHMSFHQRRCVEMYTRGDYSGWGREDGELVEEHLLEHDSRAPRSSSDRRYKEKQD